MRFSQIKQTPQDPERLLLVILLKVAHVEEILASGATQSPIRRILEHWALEMQMTS